MRKVFEIGGLVAAVVLVAFGATAIVMGINGRTTVSNSLKAEQKGFTLVPLRLYFKGGRAKLEVAVARGKQLHDKRQSAKEADAKRDIKRELSRRR